MEGGWASYGPESNQGGWGENPEPDRVEAPEALPVDVGYAEGQYAAPSPEYYGRGQPEDFPSLTDYYASLQQAAWGDFDIRVSNNLGPYVGKGLQPSNKISPQEVASLNQARLEGKNDSEAMTEYYFAVTQKKDYNQWTEFDRAAYSFAFDGMDMREQGGPLQFDEKGRPLSLYWEIALSHPKQGVGLLANAQKHMDSGYYVDFYGLSKWGNYIYDARPTTEALTAKQESQFAGGFQKLGSETDPRFQAYYDYFGNPLKEAELHRDLTGLWYTNDKGALGRAGYVIGQGRSGARGAYTLQFPNGMYIEGLNPSTFNKNLIGEEWATSPLGKERIENLKYLNMPVTDKEYAEIRGGSAALKRAEVQDKLDLIDGFNKGDYNRQDLYNAGLINKEEWALSVPTHPTENRPMTPAEIETVRTAINTGYQEGVSGVNEPWYAPAQKGLAVALDVVNKAQETLDRGGLQVGPLTLTPPLVGQVGILARGWTELGDVIHSAAAVLSSFHWMKDASPGYRERWEDFINDREARVRAIETGDLSNLPDVKDVELARNMVRNITEGYEQNMPWYGQLMAELPFYAAIPMGGVKSAVTKSAVEGLVRARTALNEITAVARSTQRFGMGDQTAIRQALKTATDDVAIAAEKLRSVGGKGVFDKQIAEGMKEYTRNLTTWKALAAEKDALVKSGKAITADLATRFNAAEQVFKTSEQRLAALTQRGLMKDALELLPKSKNQAIHVIEKAADIEKSLVDPNKTLSIQRAVRSVRGLRQAADFLGIAKEARIADERMARLATVKVIQYSQAAGIARAEVAPLRVQGLPLEYATKGVGMGIVKNVVALTPKAKAQGNHIQVVIQHPQLYKFTNPELAKYKTVLDHPVMKEVYRLQEAATQAAKDRGVPLHVIKLADDEMYLNRVPLSMKGVSVRRAERPFFERTWQQGRVIDEAKDALDYGMEYDNDVFSVLERGIASRGRAIADHELTEVLKEFSTVKLPRAEESALKAAQSRFAAFQTRINALERYQGAIPKATLNSVASLSNDIANAIKSGASREKIQNMLLEAQQAQNAEVGRLKGIVDNLNRLNPIKGIPALEGYKADPKLASQIETLFRPKYPNVLLRTVPGLNQVLRFLVTGYDMGTMFIHGLPSLFTQPRVWAKGWGNMMRSFWDKDFMTGYVAKYKEEVISAIKRGHVTYSSSEFMEGAGIINKLPVIGAISEPFERSFVAGLDTLKTEMWMARYKPFMSDRDSMALGKFIEQFTGSLSAARAGGSSSASLIETSLLFAPRYYKSWLSLMGDAMTGGLTNNQALKSFVHFQTSAHLSYWLLAKAVGQEPVMNPTDPNYFSVKFGNTYYRLGGFPMAMNKLIGQTITAAHNDPNTTFDFNSVLGTWGRFLRGRASMAARMGLDYVLGETYVGQSVTDFKDFTKYSVAEGTLPIWFRAFVQSLPKDTFNDNLSRGFWEFVGGASTPVTATKGYYERRNALAQELHGMDYQQLWESKDESNKRKARALDDVPELREMKEAMLQERLAKGAGRFANEKERLELQKRDTESKQNFSASLALAEKKLDRAGGTLEAVKSWREEISVAGRKRGEDLAQQEKDFPKLYEIMSQIDKDSIPGYMIAYREYEQAFYNDPRLSQIPYGQDEYFQIIEENRANFIQKWGEETYQEMRGAHLAGRDLPDKYVLYKTDVDDISRSGYWNLPATKDDQGVARYSFRRENPDIDAKLYIWGYVNTLQTDKSSGIVRNMLADMGMENRGTPIGIDRIQYQKDYDRLTNQMNQAYNLAYTMKANRSVDYKTNHDFVNSLQSSIRNYEKELKNAINPDVKEKTTYSLKNTVQKLEQVYHLTSNLLAVKPDDIYMRALVYEIQREMLRVKNITY